LVFAGSGCGLESCFPALAWRRVWGDHQAILFNAEVDRGAETTLINEGLWDPDTPRVTDTNQFNFHKMDL
jgi:hypothetical protein